MQVVWTVKIVEKTGEKEKFSMGINGSQEVSKNVNVVIIRGELAQIQNEIEAWIKKLSDQKDLFEDVSEVTLQNGAKTIKMKAKA